ncbi:MAG: hypothetical protein Q8S22_01230 [Eubacteriales bacterium]|jgi:hypothetical protein|nr:hypothetical protein [Eubacteriales bacterium]
MAKTRLVAKPISEARIRHRLAPSRVSAPFVRLGRLLIPAYLKFALAFEGIEIRSQEAILSEIRDFQAKKSRLIVALRHPYGDEPQLLFHVFENMLPRVARKSGDPLSHTPGLRLVHDYAVPLWSNAIIRFLLPRAGALPVYHVKCETNSLSNIRAVLRDGPNPLGLAPEGQISYHSEALPRIELGTVRMGFWCASDLEKAGRAEEVRILPVSVHYQYNKRDFGKVIAHVCRLEKLCGLESGAGKIKGDLSALLPRLNAVEHRLLSMAETYYASTYAYPVPDAGSGESEALQRQHRWNALLPVALSVAEHALGIDPGQEDLVQRMYRVRLEGWGRVYPEEALDALSPLELALADRRAGEGWFAMRHMELVDLMSYHDVAYVEGKSGSAPSDGRMVEHVLNLIDLAYRLMGGNITNRPNNIRKRAVIVPGECLNLSALLPEYRKSPKQTARIATEALAKKLEHLIERYHHETNS